MRPSPLIAVLLAAAPALAAEHATWDDYVKVNRYQCPGPFDALAKPRKLTIGGKRYVHSGYKLEVQNPDADDVVRIGVVSAIKDATPATKKNVAAALAWFKQKGVEWVIANGDLAVEELDLEETLRALGDSGLSVLVIPGNSESKAAFTRVFKSVGASQPGLVNGVLVRQIIADDVELWTLPGYYDRSYVHQGAGCAYGQADVEALRSKLRPSGKVPLAIVSHGPPLGSGSGALDFIADKRNVGDPHLARLLRELVVPVGLFGHILEAGGAAVGADLSTPVAAGQAVSALYVNAGSVSADPWKLNDGSTSRGMAMVVTVGGGSAQYDLRRFDPAE